MFDVVWFSSRGMVVMEFEILGKIIGNLEDVLKLIKVVEVWLFYFN